jgi:3-methyladenine DNA glycosylase AlkD
MNETNELARAEALAAEMDAELRALPVRNAPSERAVRRRYSRRLREAPAELVMAVARRLIDDYGHRGDAYELIGDHRAAFASLGVDELEALGEGINSWWTVDGFARTLAGPAWLAGQIGDEVIDGWAGSADRWWRRAALVSTVALNVRSHGGTGDTPRTLAVCRQLADDHDDMVVKALSWALRELVVHDPDGVRGFLAEHEDALAARVKREVTNKLTTGLKNPRRGRD